MKRLFYFTGNMPKELCYGLYVLGICIFSINEIGIIGVAILFTMMTIDTITGRAKSHVFGTYHSKKLKRGIFAKLLELLILFGILLMSDLSANILGDGQELIGITFNGLIGLLAAAELISAITNYLSIKTGEEYKEQDYVTKILSYVLGLMKKRLDILDVDPKKTPTPQTPIL